MIYLFLVSLLWAFSFGLIKEQLTILNPHFVAFVRLFIAFLVFVPLFHWQKLKDQWRMVVIGAVQFGLMYIFYIYSYQYLLAFQVALFTIFTPIYVALFNDFLEKTFHRVHFVAALLSVIGTGIILWKQAENAMVIKGFLLVQISNICFALGQVLYRRYRQGKLSILEEARVFAALYLGAVIITGLTSALSVDWGNLVLKNSQIWTFTYLGIIASGFGFFLWNYGAVKVNAGTLAVFNNLKIPLAILVSLLIFSEETNISRLLFGGMIVSLALWINEKFSRK